MFDIYSNGRCSQNDDLYFLRFYREYQLSVSPIEYDYLHNDARLAGVRNQIPSEIIQQSKGEFDLQCRLMLWLHKTLPGGNCTPVHPFNILTMLERSRETGYKASCWAYAIALNEIFLSYGFRSRMVRCLPLDLRPSDCHCMTLAYSNEYRKWIAFDAAMGTYYRNKDGIPLSLKEMRNNIINTLPIIMPFLPRKISQPLYWYLCKNFIRFQSYQTSCFNMEEQEHEQIIYNLNPFLFQTEDKEIVLNSRQVFMKNIYSSEDFWGLD